MDSSGFETQLKAKKEELKELGIYDRMELWMKIHKDSEKYHKALGITGIICAVVSSQLSGYPQILLVTGLVAAISTSGVTFLNLNSRSVTYVNAWRILDGKVTEFLTDEQARVTVADVGNAETQAEKYIQDALHKKE